MACRLLLDMTAVCMAFRVNWLIIRSMLQYLLSVAKYFGVIQVIYLRLELFFKIHIADIEDLR